MNQFDFSHKPAIDPALVWENYWKQTAELSQPILWDVSADRVSAVDLTRFQNFFDPSLPLIDFACGNGTQTYFLAQHFPRVLGVDVSPSALELAKKDHSAANIEYRLLDALQPERAEELHAEIGDANIYLRGSLHHIPLDKRPQFVDSLKRLLGQTGMLYLIELGAGTDEYYNSLFGQFDELPEAFTLVMKHGIRPGNMTLDDLKTSFPDFKFLASGEAPIPITLQFPNGENAALPGIYAILQHH